MTTNKTSGSQVEKADPERLSRAYLEEALSAARRMLPGWQYSVIHAAAVPRSGAKARNNPARPTPSRIQSLVFDKARFDQAQAVRWAKDHDYESGKVDETEDSFRLRQEEPGQFDEMRTIDITDGVKGVLGIRGARKESLAKQAQGVICALWCPADVAQRLAIEGGERPEDMHVTLCHLGDANEMPPWAYEAAHDAIRLALRDQPPLSGKVSGAGAFQKDGTNIIHAMPDVPGLAEMRQRVVDSLRAAGISVSDDHGFDPHITLAYAPAGTEPKIPTTEPIDLAWSECCLAAGPVRITIPFGQRDADADASAGWIHEALELTSRTGEAAPAGSELKAYCETVQGLLTNALVELGVQGDEGEVEMAKASWDSAYVNDLPDSAFLHIQPGGEKDEGGRTVPRSLRHFPVRGADGKPDLPHVRNAIARIPQSSSPELSASDRSRLQDIARRMLEDLGRTSKAQPSETPALSLPAGAIATTGEPGVALMFVGGAPTPLDIARREPLSGPAGSAFKDEFLAGLGLRKEDVSITHLVPVRRSRGEPDSLDVSRWRAWIDSELVRMRPRVVVALGSTAKAALGSRAAFCLPHPSSLRKGDTRGEVARKMKSIRRALTDAESAGTKLTKHSAPDPITGTSGERSSVADPPGNDDADARRVLIAKADRAKQVVYGVVLDPYTVDTQNDWTPPAQIEQAAHRWLMESRVIGLNHEGKAAAQPVESFMVPYPTAEDYAKAMRNEPHKAARITLGNQEVGSGAWVLGVRVADPKLWRQVEEGKLDAFSIGGFSERLPTTRAAMPTVEFR